MPSPSETEFRIQLSPVPTQTIFGSFGSIAIAPIDCTRSLSNFGVNVLPPFIDFHTPPLAAPTYTVSRLPSCTAATDVTRPDITAEPILRAPSPEMVSESTTTDPVAATRAVASLGGAGNDAGLGPAVPDCGANSAGTTFSPTAGLMKRRSSRTGFTVIRSHAICCLSALELFRAPTATANGKSTPCTSL